MATMRQLSWPALAGLAAVLALSVAPVALAAGFYGSPTPTPSPSEPSPAPTPAPDYDPNRDFYAYREKRAGPDYYPRNRKYGRLGYELDPPFANKTCGDCIFNVNSRTLVLERLPGCNPTSCVGSLNLSSTATSDDGMVNFTFLGIAPDTFQGMHQLTHLDLSGQPISNNPPGMWDDFDNRGEDDAGVSVNLRNTLYSCYPPYNPCSKSQHLCWNGFPRITFQMSLLIDKNDVCHYVNSCGYKQHNCTVWRNNAGMASIGGECKSHCQDFDISGKGVRDLPHLPNGLVDGITALNILKIDDEVVLKPTRMFSTRNLMGKRLFVLKQNNESWAFAGKAWFTVPHNHRTVTMSAFVQ
uniref:Uncharacterized protein n=1 Tax=Hemiselmis tepida TaxID=464990 RepID=A0A7S0YY68_9CRYP|mmetsp:Transcript_29994/g.75941  ORF Transcript_29994/g.75941 Transcript_29994/m.75941 type:complete len:355 (+) Transcript_29994:59-1123(+)|eukprot:CAMPEP_0174920580 /NCGR_PEP_ID=MMETSP1355-20121228/4510_1 /TAXON_ID=464990 /ORGANISM="Hemiselmis tepida, Strain CCMP443" /LENGTH=354 /DNA_ID=CAMNT_0016165945 /DNA_START=51 /DNA_END=1115 /DNA_ORIENTATION=-